MREYHVEPWWYFVPVLLVGCLPWSLLLVPFTRFLFDRSASARALRPQALGFFLLWATWCVLFFSASSSKLPPYVLPALPALALLVGSYLDRALFQAVPAGLFRTARTLTPRLGMAVLAVCGMVAGLVVWHLGLIGVAQALVQSALCLVVIFALVLWGKRLTAAAAWLVCGILSAVMVLEAAQEIVPAWAQQRSAVCVSERWADLVRDGRTPVVCYGGEWGSIPFSLGRADMVFNCCDVQDEDVKKFVTEHARYVLVVRHRRDLEYFRRFLSAGGTMTTIRDAGEIQVTLVDNGQRAAE
jgi:dolichol-phosphate mannosyltransferase